MGGSRAVTPHPGAPRALPLGLAALLGALSACAHLAPAGVSADPAYERALEAATAREQLFRGFDRIVNACATLQSPGFRAARASRQSGLFGLTPAEARALEADEARQAAAETDLEVGLFIDPQSQNDLDEPNSIWHVQLLFPDGTALAPTSIEGRHEPDPNERTLYPYLQRFWVAYTVRFPPPPPGEGGPPTLRIASSLGKVDLVFPKAP